MRAVIQLCARRALQVMAIVSVLACLSEPARSSSGDAGAALEAPPVLAGRYRPEPVRVALGRLLFHDPRLSSNREIACSSCHVLTKFGVDAKATSIGVGGVHGRRNAPSVFNAATQVAQFWDGRAVDVEAEATSQIMNPLEMAMPSERAVTKTLSRVSAYVRLFHQAFPGDPRPVSLKNVGDAIGAFVRGLLTDSRWDRFVAGDASALTAGEKTGLRVFRQRGCVVCHAGPQVGGTSFQRLGAVVPWPNQSDQGRVEITKYPPDRMVFKVPSLKNVAETAPYFHDGSTASLESAIRLMGRHQLGIDMEDDEVRAIAEWMRALTGTADPAYIAVPQLPPA